MNKPYDLIEVLEESLRKHIKKKMDVDDVIHQILRFSATSIQYFIGRYSTAPHEDRDIIIKEFEKLMNFRFIDQ